MLRLDLKDKNETVLFIEPFRGSIAIHKSVTDIGLYIDAYDNVTFASYYSEGSRDEAYEYVLNKINDYLFPQVADFSSIPIPFEFSDIKEVNK